MVKYDSKGLKIVKKNTKYNVGITGKHNSKKKWTASEKHGQF